jgi:hypothetical protein
MKGWVSHSVAGVLAVAATLGIRGLSHVPFAAERDPRAVVRLSWRVLGQQIQDCRRLSAQELEALPAHMRREEVCEGRVAPYRLRVLVDGELADSGLVRASGARRDRPIYVFREISIDPGEHRLEISFVSERPAGEQRQEPGAGQVTPSDSTPALPDSGAVRAPSSGVTATVRTADAAPAELRLDTRLVLEPRAIALVIYDSETRELVLQERAPDEGDGSR